MGNRIVYDWLVILALYVLACASIFLLTSWADGLGPDMPDRPDLTTEQFEELFQYASLGIVGISLLATLAWYVLGTWGLRAYSTGRGRWIAVWGIGLMLTFLAVLAALIVPGHPQVLHDNMTKLGLFYAGIGVLPYYVATVLFSPADVKYVVPGSKALRRW